MLAVSLSGVKSSLALKVVLRTALCVFGVIPNVRASERPNPVLRYVVGLVRSGVSPALHAGAAGQVAAKKKYGSAEFGNEVSDFAMSLVSGLNIFHCAE